MLETLLTSVAMYTLKKWPALARLNSDLTALRQYLDHSEDLPVLPTGNKPDDLVVRLVTTTVLWAIPIERLDDFEKGLRSLYRDNGSLLGIVRDEEELVEIVRRCRQAFRGGTSVTLGTLTVPRSVNTVKRLQLTMHHSLPSLIVLAAEVSASDSAAEELERLTVVERKQVVRLRTLSRLGKRSKSVLHFDSPLRSRSEDVEDFVMDLKWDVHEFLTKYFGKHVLSSDTVPPSVDVFALSSSGGDLQHDRALDDHLRCFGISWGDFFHSASRGGEYHVFCSDLERARNSDRFIRIFADTSKIVGTPGRIGPAERAAISVQTDWVRVFAPLLVMRSLLEPLEAKLAEMRAYFFDQARLGRGRWRKKLTDLLTSQQELNRLALSLRRLQHDSTDILKVEPKDDTELPDNDQPLDMPMDLIPFMRPMVSQKIEQLADALNLVEATMKSEIDLRLVLNGERWQRLAFAVASLSLVVATIALFPEQAKLYGPKSLKWVVETAGEMSRAFCVWFSGGR